ncbi:MAG: hypothetical protein WCP69_15125 [Bacteroidota bacterium]
MKNSRVFKMPDDAVQKHSIVLTWIAVSSNKSGNLINGLSSIQNVKKDNQVPPKKTSSQKFNISQNGVLINFAETEDSLTSKEINKKWNKLLKFLNL